MGLATRVLSSESRDRWRHKDPHEPFTYVLMPGNSVAPAALLIHHRTHRLRGDAKHGEEYTLHPSGDFSRTPWRLTDGTHAFEQAQPLIAHLLPLEEGRWRRQGSGSPAETRTTSGAETFLTDGLGKPGRLRPDQPGQRSRTRQTARGACCRVRGRGLGVLFEKRRCPGKYLHSRARARRGGVNLRGREAAALADPVLSAAFVPHVRSARRQNLRPDD